MTHNRPTNKLYIARKHPARCSIFSIQDNTFVYEDVSNKLQFDISPHLNLADMGELCPHCNIAMWKYKV